MLSVLILCGIWITLQFKFIQRDEPKSVLVLERLLFMFIPIIMPLLLDWVIVTVFHSTHISMFFVIFTVLYYSYFIIPQQSSFLKSNVSFYMKNNYNIPLRIYYDDYLLSFRVENLEKKRYKYNVILFPCNSKYNPYNC